ncbi:hypothetical protein A5725_17995 [Mycobacterium kubicae]|uniref:hypothetical protein n=1 Tax=Mycobacterium kubicae TaxID=120959 RepID=UPI0007FCFB35|nr:hypothetical protein [Mycobacterium kubicae]OBF19903.1 hypothetical protein A5725_17995 [Mycobacterium kubicae]
MTALEQQTVDRDEEDQAVATDLESTSETHSGEEDSVSSIESETPDDEEAATSRKRRPIVWSRVLAFGVLPGLALLLTLAAGYFKWVDVTATEVAQARADSVRVASEDAVALLSYQADSADKELGAARERLTGDFKDAYTALTREVVIPGAKQKHISAVAKVSAASSVSATAKHAVVLLYVNQSVTIGDGAPTDTQPVIRVTLEKANGHWLVSRFDPV